MKTEVQQDNEGEGKNINTKQNQKIIRNAFKDLFLKIITFMLSRKNRAA